MKILDRYIAGLVFINFGVALAALLAVFSVITTMQELELVGSGRYGLLQVAAFVLMTLPLEACELFPAAALLGGVSALGWLAVHQELTPLWSAGVSPWRLVWSVMLAAAVLVVGVALTGEFVATPLAQQAESRRSVAISGSMALSTTKGFWARDGSRFVNIRTALRGSELHDLYVYEFDDSHRLQTFLYAKSASYGDREWRLYDAVESRIVPDSGVRTRRLRETALRNFVSRKQLDLLLSRPENLSLLELISSIVSLQERGENSGRYELVLWQRITTPIATVVMLLISVPLVVVARPRARIGERIAAAALLGIGFKMLTDTSAQLGLVYGVGPALGTTVPIVMAFLGALWLMRSAGRAI